MPTTQKTVARNSIIMMGGTIIVAAISIIATGYIARNLGKADYGTLTFGITFSAFFLPFTNMGLRAVTVRKLASDRTAATHYLSKILTLRVFLYILVGALIIVFSNVLSYPRRMVFTIYIFTLGLFFDVLSTSYRDLFQAFERMQYIVYIDLVLRIFSASCSCLLLFLGFGLFPVAFTYVGASCLAFLASAFYANKFGIRIGASFNLTFFYRTIRDALPFGGATLVKAAQTRLDVLLLSKLVPIGALGLYGASANLMNRLSFVSGSISTASFPTIARLFREDNRDLSSLLRNLFSFSLILSLPIAVVITNCSEQIVQIIFGPEFIESAAVLRVLGLSFPFLFMTAIQDSSLQAMDGQKFVFLLNICNLVLLLGLNFFLIFPLK